MAYRLDMLSQDGALVLQFQGLLDANALAGLRASLAQARRNGTRARVVLRAGTEVEQSCLAELRAMGAEVSAEAAYLATWLRAAK